MAFNFGLIAHAAHGKAVKFAIQGARDTFADACFAHAWRTHEANDTPFDATGELSHANKF